MMSRFCTVFFFLVSFFVKYAFFQVRTVCGMSALLYPLNLVAFQIFSSLLFSSFFCRDWCESGINRFISFRLSFDGNMFVLQSNIKLSRSTSTYSIRPLQTAKPRWEKEKDKERESSANKQLSRTIFNNEHRCTWTRNLFYIFFQGWMHRIAFGTPAIVRSSIKPQIQHSIILLCGWCELRVCVCVLAGEETHETHDTSMDEEWRWRKVRARRTKSSTEMSRKQTSC